jgi:hypothetical protein
LKESKRFDSVSSTFLHNRVRLPEEKVITPSDIEASDTIVIFSNRAFPERSFPAVSNAIHVPASGFENSYIGDGYQAVPVAPVSVPVAQVAAPGQNIFPPEFTAHDKAVCRKMAKARGVDIRDVICFYNQAGRDLDHTMALILAAIGPE